MRKGEDPPLTHHRADSAVADQVIATRIVTNTSTLSWALSWEGEEGETEEEGTEEEGTEEEDIRADWGWAGEVVGTGQGGLSKGGAMGVGAEEEVDFNTSR